MTLSIGIVGAGIGGLASALALRDAGFSDLTVYEQADTIADAGAGIQLAANATSILHALGLEDALARIGSRPQAIQLRAAKSGHTIARLPLGARAEARYGAPYYHVHRGDLVTLLGRICRERGVRILTGERVTGAEPARGEIAFADGSARAHDLVVGADGIRSVLGEQLFGPESPRFTGHVAWRALVPAERLNPEHLAATVTAWLGPRRHFVHYCVRGGALVNLVGIVERETPPAESWSLEGDPAELAADFAGWHPLVATLIGNAGACFKWPLYERDTRTVWSRGRITLLGDACHAMLPYLAQGGAMAIEDAWVLSRMLERRRDEPAAALAEYERHRRPRVRRVQRSTRAQGRMYHLDRPMAVLKRNVTLALGSRLLPATALERYDWLHGYDAVHGFD